MDHFYFYTYEKKKGARSSMWGYVSHSFLKEYIRKNKCKRIMELGVAEGENARSMVKTAFKNFLPEDIEYYGFDYFRGSRYNRVQQKLKETGCIFRLFKGDTLESLPKVSKTLPKMDLIFIDGGKSYIEAKNDWKHSKTLMHHRTAVFIHNYGFSGVRRMVNEINREEYLVKIIRPPSDDITVMIKKR